jgi:DNA helicase-2/ATP-dependent DNA helicase PcrA
MDFQKQFSSISSDLTIEKLWKFARFSPNPQQEEAIRHVSGPLYLAAGPGSGKTRVLLWRTLNLIVFHDAQPEEVFLSTFTEKAAHQLKEGLRGLLGYVTNYTGQPYDLAQMYVGTVHSLCHRILTDRRRFSSFHQRKRPPRLLDELGQYFHVYRNRNWNQILEGADLGEDSTEIIKDVFGSRSQSKHEAVRNMLAWFNRLSEEVVNPEEALARLRNGDEMLLEYLNERSLSPDNVQTALDLYIAYQQTLSAGKVPLIDFALIQQAAYHALQDIPDSSTIFKHVIVDEYQDTNTIQERIFFKLANGTNNICVVGDDDQALYRFRGATVENFVEFPKRIEEEFGQKPKRITLSTNYRSRKRIVDFYKHFMEYEDWSKENGGEGFYRVIDKEITANKQDPHVSVVASSSGHPVDLVVPEIAAFVKKILDAGKVKDPNQIAFLFPSLKSVQVDRMKEALQAVGLQVYAPRAGRFLEVDESFDLFGLLVQVFGRPTRGDFRGGDYHDFMDWLDQIEDHGKDLMKSDPNLKQYIEDKRAELERIVKDYRSLLRVVERNHWDINSPYDLARMKRPLLSASGFSDEGRKLLGSQYLDRIVEQRVDAGTPLSLKYIIRRVTSVDWNILDLFYRFCGFDHFKKMFDLAEHGQDEGPICNMGLITQYLSRFIEERMPMLTADVFADDLFLRVFFMSYLYPLYRLGEAEYEDAEDPFPKGRIPFLTIHQAKGLEFPVVILGNPSKRDYGPGIYEEMVRPFLDRDSGEPLDRMSSFDNMRMFYVALSRAENLLVLAHYHSRGNSVNEPFKTMLDNNFPRIPNFDLDTLPAADHKKTELPKNYSFTTDYLGYQRCPRQYMVFRKYGFVPSRSETMFFGSLVHRTLEDLHHELIRRREEASA